MTELTPEDRVWNLVRGALGTRALTLAAELRVADALADGPRAVRDVAQEVGADADALHRLLRALASDGVFAEEAPGVFRNTEASELLRGGGWDDFAHLFGGVWYRAVEQLAATAEPVFPGERDEAQWRSLLDSAGFAVEHIEDGLIQASVARSSGAADGSGPENTL
jgi:hypothetical protein